MRRVPAVISFAGLRRQSPHPIPLRNHNLTGSFRTKNNTSIIYLIPSNSIQGVITFFVSMILERFAVDDIGRDLLDEGMF